MGKSNEQSLVVLIKTRCCPCMDIVSIIQTNYDLPDQTTTKKKEKQNEHENNK